MSDTIENKAVKLSDLTSVTQLIKDYTDEKDTNKVDKIEGKSLLDDTEIERLKGVNNYDDTEVKENIAEVKTDVTKLSSQIDEIVNEEQYKYSMMQLHYYENVLKKLMNKESLKITCLGDSLTYGQDSVSSDCRPAKSDTTLDLSWGGHVSKQASKTYPERLKEMLDDIYGNDICTVINRGISGLKTQSCLDIWTTNNNSDITYIMLGTNDCKANIDLNTYKENYDKIIRRHLNWGSALILLTSPPTINGEKAKMENYRKIVEVLGKKYNIPVLDTTLALKNYPDTIYSDTIHFNANGYSLFSNLVCSTLIGYTNVNKKYTIKQNDKIYPTYLHYGTVGETIIKNNNADLSIANSSQGYMWQFSGGQKTYISFYSADDYLTLFPLYNGSGQLKITLDNGIIQPNNINFYSNLGVTLQQNLILPTENNMGLTSYKALQYNNLNTNGITIPNRGWHTILLENIGTKGVFVSGFLVVKPQDFLQNHNICTSSSRPTSVRKGFLIYDEDLDKLIIYGNNGWKDTNGNYV